MIGELWPQYSYQLRLTILPTVLFIIFSQYHIHNGLSVKKRIRGAFFDFLTSFMVLFTFQFWVSAILVRALLIPESYRLIFMYVVYLGAGFLFAALFAKVIRLRNKFERKKIVPKFGLFIYAQYLTMIYVALIFASSALAYNLTIVILAEIWYVIFSKDFDIMEEIYPTKLVSESNISLFFEYVVVLIIWFMPEAVANLSSVDGDSVFFKWLSFLSMFLYIFLVVNHKIIFNELYHSHMESINLRTDRVTKLMSRVAFIEAGQMALDNANEDGKNTAIVFMNISRFKYYNQNYGNDIGDNLLRIVADCIRDNFRNEELVARLSDDHFAILLNDEAEIDERLKKLVDNIESKENEFSIQCKIGVYITNGKEKDIIEILDGAMVASNNVKLEEGERILYYNEEILEIEKTSLYVLQNIDKAVEENWLRVYYQPIINVEDASINSAEALVRWIDDVHGFLPPDKFIPILEEQNLIYKVDCFVLEQICRDHVYLKEMGMDLYPIGFNISRKDFFSIDMVNFVEETVTRYGIPRNLIKIEITESALTTNDVYIAKQIERFSKLGYKVWMDDFGSGYSSLNALGDFKFDGIKLDLVFLRNMNPVKKELMRGIVLTAKNLGLDVLTEGVESQEQYQLLQEIGCDNAQGYLFSKPLPLDDHIQLRKY